MKKPARTRITSRLVKEMRVDRASGMTHRALMVKYDISAWAVRYHTSEENQRKMRAYEKARYERDKLDPDKLARRRAAALAHQRKTKRPPKRTVNPALVEEVRSSRGSGEKFLSIAARLGVSTTTVHRYWKMSSQADDV